MASANVDTAMQFYTVYNEKKLDLIDTIFTDSYVGHVNAHDIVGAENAKGFIGGFVKGIPDAFYAVKDVFENGDRVICRWTCTECPPPTTRWMSTASQSSGSKATKLPNFGTSGINIP